jgi:hypothetical protein
MVVIGGIRNVAPSTHAIIEFWSREKGSRSIIATRRVGIA